MKYILNNVSTLIKAGWVTVLGPTDCWTVSFLKIVFPLIVFLLQHIKSQKVFQCNSQVPNNTVLKI